MQKEINKLLRRVSAEKLKKNHRECIELYNIIGGLYSEIGSYDEASYYHEQALEICKTIGDRLQTAIAFRHIGEAKAAQCQFYQAIDYIKKYLDLAQRANNKVEIQRAWTTLGRVYLMQAQDFKDNSHVVDDQTKTVALEAESRFQTALNLADSVREEVDRKEFLQMKAGLLINIGLVKDICGQHTESVMKFNQAILLCREAKLKEDLYRCHVILTGIFRQKNNVKDSVKSSDEAVRIAKEIGKKILICDAYIEKGLVQILQRDFKGAKRCFAQAYLEKSPSEEDHAKAIRLTKLAHLIATTHEQLGNEGNSSETRLKLCDKLGDLFVSVNNYKLAVEFYRRALNEAKICCKPKNELAKILISIAETYADDGHFQHALAYYEKELTFKNGNQEEQCQTLLKIAHMNEYLGCDTEKTSDAYEKALDKAGKHPKLMYQVLNDYIPYLERKDHNNSRRKELEKTLESLKSYPEVIEYMENAGLEESDDMEDEISDIDEVITDDEDNEEVAVIGRRRCRGNKRFKANEVGDTPLHEACIKGDLKRVKLLLSQGHDVNPRDNAGWIPLHEASNHGHYAIVEHLIENGADVSNRGLKGMSPLHDAATNGHYEIMRLLMRSGANVIALTDTGETVLSCLRDYKKRNYSDMSNQEMSEYKAMEAELLNTMDKSGFNLMEENLKKAATSTAKASTSAKIRPSAGANVMHPQQKHRQQQRPSVVASTSEKVRSSNASNVRSRSSAAFGSASSSSAAAAAANKMPHVVQQKQHRIPRDRLPISLNDDTDEDNDEDANDPNVKYNYNTNRRQPTSESVRDYRHTMSDLKRRRVSHKEDSPPRTDLPATYGATSNPSAPTKEWLMADDHVEFSDDDDELIRASAKPSEAKSRAVLNSDEEDAPAAAAAGGDDDDDDDIEIITEKAKQQQQPVPSASPFQSPEEPQVLSPTQETQDAHPMDQFEAAPRENEVLSSPLYDLSNFSANSHNSRTSLNAANFDLMAAPMKVSMAGKTLLIPFKDKLMTIKALKDVIVSRFVTLTEAEPIITLTLASQPNYVLYDEDLCIDMISEYTLVAKIESWILDPIVDTYENWCQKHEPTPLEPATSIRAELRHVEQSGEILDQTYCRYPPSHLKPYFKALAYRDFSQVNLTGSAGLLDGLDEGRLLMDTMASWMKLSSIKLTCLGLRASHFKTICNGMRFPELTSLDLSHNSIAIKSKEEFKELVESLLENCPKLKSLDLTRNVLQFLKPIQDQIQASKTPASAAGDVQVAGSLVQALGLSKLSLELKADRQNMVTIQSWYG